MCACVCREVGGSLQRLSEAVLVDLSETSVGQRRRYVVSWKGRLKSGPAEFWPLELKLCAAEVEDPWRDDSYLPNKIGRFSETLLRMGQFETALVVANLMVRLVDMDPWFYKPCWFWFPRFHRATILITLRRFDDALAGKSSSHSLQNF